MIGDTILNEQVAKQQIKTENLYIVLGIFETIFEFFTEFQFYTT